MSRALFLCAWYSQLYMGATLLKRAKKLFHENEYDECLRLINDSTDETPDVRLLLLHAACQQRLHHYEESSKDLSLALELDPSNPSIYKGLIASYRLQGLYAAAFEALVDFAFYSAQSRAPRDDLKREWESNLKFFVSAQRRKVDADMYERALATEVPPVEGAPEKLRVVYDYIHGDSSLNIAALQELKDLRYKKLKKQLAAIDARLKNSLSYTTERANTDKLAVYCQSPYLETLQLLIAATDDDHHRHKLESEELELLIAKLRVSTEDQKLPLQQLIRNKAEDMVLFECLSRIAFELYFDFHPPGPAALDDLRTRAGPDRPNKASEKVGAIRPAPESDTSKVLPVKKISGDLSIASGTPEMTPEDLGVSLQKLNISDESSAEIIERYIESFPRAALAELLRISELNSGRIAAELVEYKGECLFGYAVAVTWLLKAGAYAQLIDAVHRGLAACENREKIFGVDVSSTKQQLQLALASCYVQYEAPKNYALAADLFERILKTDPHCVQALVGQSHVLLHQGLLDDAEELLQRVCANEPENEFARAELGWVEIKKGDHDYGIQLTERCLLAPHLLPSRRAELYWRIGYAKWESDRKRESYDSFIAALQASSTYAAAFTYLGLFYEEVVHDDQRAQRCFFKAFEISSAEVVAGQHLAANMADNGQWDLVEVIAMQCIDSIRSRGLRDVDWPYRAMGVISLNRRAFAEAVSYFQASLRYSGVDVEAWIGLGEAYINTGRYNSAVKSLCRAIELDPQSFSAHYMLSLAQRENADYPGSASSIKRALQLSTSSSTALKYALIENAIRAASTYASNLLLADALEELATAVRTSKEILTTESLDVAYGGCAEAVVSLHHLGHTRGSVDSELQGDLDELAALVAPENLEVECEFLLDLAERCALAYVRHAEKQRIATAHYLVARIAALRNDFELAVRHFQLAIEREPRNAQFWNAYGVCLWSRNPAVAQHCFVRSLSINGHDAQTWANLAAFYLATTGDHDLAEEALNRSLSLDSENSRAWLVQALIASAEGSKKGSYLLRTLEYAYTLRRSDTLACFALALREYNDIESKPTTLGALEQLLSTQPSNRDAQLLMALLFERRGEYNAALDKLVALSEPLHLGRVLLALGRYNDAVDTVVAYEPDTDAGLLSRYLTLGLAHYFQNDFDEAIENFVEALSCPPELHESVLRTLVEVLYASGRDDARETAVEQLFTSIGENGATLQVTLLLAAIGLLSGDTVVCEAALSELQVLDIAVLEGKALANACFLISLLQQNDDIYGRLLFQKPLVYETWRDVNKPMALTVARALQTDPAILCRALYETDTLENCTRAVFIQPGDAVAQSTLKKKLEQT